MSRLKIYKENDAETTAVANRFIDEYMKEANDAQIKVYLFLLRMFQANIATSVSDIADKFNHTEKEVIRALKYWERNKLLSLEYDEDKTLIGIKLKDIRNSDRNCTDISADASSEAIPVQAHTSETTEREILLESLEKKESEVRLAKEMTKEVSAGSFEKPSYTTAQLREFKSRENTEQLLFIAEQYIGKPLSPSEMKSILFFTDTLHFSDDLIDYLIQYCVDRGKKDFKYIERVAVSWAEQGITTPRQAQKFASRYDQNAYSIMNELGKNTIPTNKEMEFINRWLKDYGFSLDIIYEACARTVLATDKHRFEYADGILSRWKDQNIHHKADIDKIDTAYRQKKKIANSKEEEQGANKFNRFAQNNYDFDLLEKELISN